jgi:diketogulonate reductase-like aldo/keto reductase
MKTNKNFTLYNGIKIPDIGFGTWQIPNGRATYDAVSYALSVGYRHIDTANAYRNEESLGRAVRDSGISRSEIFITSKLPAEIKSYKGALESYKDTMKNLNLDYLDLYLIHAPWPWEKMGKDFTKENIEVWKAMEEIYDNGRCHSIGVSNFSVTDLTAIIDNRKIVPMANQIKFFIGKPQTDITHFCKNNNILVEGYSPLATGRILKNEMIATLAKKYNKTVAQLCICYVLQSGALPLPKSTTPDRILQNMDVYFEIADEDMIYLNSVKTL